MDVHTFCDEIASYLPLDFDDEKQKALYESVIISTKKINELNIVLELGKAKISVLHFGKQHVIYVLPL